MQNVQNMARVATQNSAMITQKFKSNKLKKCFKGKKLILEASENSQSSENLKNSTINSIKPSSSTTSSSSSTPHPIGTCIIPNKLYLSDLYNAQDINYLKNNNITAIISLYFQALPQQIVSSLQNYKHIKIADNCSENISRYFQDCTNFIENNETVLVHCQSGISRSPTIVMAYLMSKMRFGWKEAQAYVQERRSIIAPNFSFIGQLFTFEATMIREKMTDRFTEKYAEKFTGNFTEKISENMEKYKDKLKISETITEILRK